jgi:UDP-glucose 4-epimerase
VKVVVTGGAGYLGAELVAVLSARTDLEEIVVYDNLSRGSHGLITGPPLGSTPVRFAIADILDSRSLRRDLAGASVVFHLAAKVSTPHAIHGQHHFEQVNHWGTAEVVYACEDVAPGALLVYPSTTAVYGPGTDHASRTSRPSPESEYARSKLRGESHVLRFGDRGRALVLRLANMYGPGRCVRFDAVINRFVLDSRLMGRLQVAGDGSQRRTFIHVDEVVSTLSGLLDSPMENGVFDLAASTWSVDEIASAIDACGPTVDRLFVEQHLSLFDLTVLRDDRLAAIQPANERSLVADLRDFVSRLTV